MTTIIPHEKACIENGINVLLVGMHGTGKSATVRGMAKRHNMKIAVFNCAMMDPYTDLIGVPIPHEWIDASGQRKRVLEMVAPPGLEEANAIFLDEVNRGAQEVHNALLEIMNEKSLNGRPLPNLKIVIGAINPPGSDNGYHVQELDPAFDDRFLVKVNVSPEPSVEVMTEHDGLPKPVARALVKWWSDADHKRRDTYISPRRLAQIGLAFMAVQDDRSFLDTMMPTGVTADTGKLHSLLLKAVGKDAKVSESDVKLAETEPSVEAPKAKSDGAKRAGVPRWLKASHGSDPKRMTWAGKHSVDDLVKQMKTWSQPTQSKFRTNLHNLTKGASKSECEQWRNVIDAINSVTRRPSSRIMV